MSNQNVPSRTCHVVSSGVSALFSAVVGGQTSTAAIYSATILKPQEVSSELRSAGMRVPTQGGRGEVQDNHPLEEFLVQAWPETVAQRQTEVDGISQKPIMRR